MASIKAIKAGYNRVMMDGAYSAYEAKFTGDAETELQVLLWFLRGAWASFKETVRYYVGGLVCARRGHARDMEVQEYIHCERDESGRITDMDGGSVEWFCPRCGQGGVSYF